jgi:hypothetical protein
VNGHEKVVCSCGAIIMQCRCMHEKVLRVVQNGCERCKLKAPEKEPFPGIYPPGPRVRF